MEIKTITCHDVYNAGASLQAYALQTYLKSLGHNVEIIDYKPSYLSNHYSFSAVNPTFNKPIIKQLYLLAKFPGRFKAYHSKRKANFDAFKNDYLCLTKNQYHSNEELKTAPPFADVYFAGSDQIWNPLFNNGKDPAFYLDFAPKDSIKASYAASFAVDSFPNEYVEKTKKYLENFDYISVRESSGIKILNSLGFNDCINVCDPVFLLDRNYWEKLTYKISTEDYLLIYDFDNSEKVKSIAEKVAKEKNLKIYSIFKLPYADKCFYDEGPLGFLSLVKNAKFIVSNSFHATAFSIIFKKPFCVVNRQEEINTRMKDLLIMLGMENRLLSADFQLNLDNLFEISDYSNLLKNNIDDSKKYISMVLNNE